MSDNNFKDYYKILQVHYEASPEVIRAAHKKLSKSYHPDTNPDDNGRMALLNEAFTVLNQPESRRDYHKKCISHFFPDNNYSQKITEKAAPATEETAESAAQIMESFFHYLKAQDFEAAYQLLTSEDKDRILYEDFADWREAVDNCTRMQSYKVNFMRSFSNCRLDQIQYRRVIEFRVEITELDLLTSETNSDTIRKCAVYDGFSWHIWLGVSNIKSATLRFRMLAEKSKAIDPMAIYRNAVSKIDPLTGLLSEYGFYEEAEREVARTRRYNNPFTLLAFQIHCNSKEKETASLCQLAALIKANLRTTDIAARLSGNQIICLLTETRKYSGDMTAKKFLRLISEKQIDTFHVSFGVVFYNGFNDIHDAVLAACSIADNGPVS